MSEWYYADAGRQRLGPFSGEELALRFHQGKLRLDTLVWRDGIADWQPLRQFTAELALDQAPSEVFYTPVEAAPPATPLDAGLRDSPYAPPSATLLGRNSAVIGGEVVYAGFWKRVAANFIDSIVIGVVGAIIGAILGGLMGLMLGMNGGLGGGGFAAIQVVTNLVSLAITAFYYAWFHASSSQATLGKMAVGIKVVRSDGDTISFLRGIGRYFGFLLSSLLLGIGLLMAAFTERKQGLHDLLCDTLVVDKWAFTDHPEWQKPELGVVTIVILALFGILLAGLLVMFAVIAGLAASSAG